MSEKVRKRYEEIAETLMQKIQDGEFQPGDRIPSERYLAKEYNVSRSVIREALRSMEQIGCVEPRIGGGTFVKFPEISAVVDPLAIIFSQDEQFAFEITETRLILETEIVKLAAKRRTEEQIRQMRSTLYQMQREILKGGKGIEEDAKFHNQLAEAAGNRALQLLVATCAEVLNRSMEVTQRMEGVPQKALIDHERVLDAVEQKDGKAAERCMRIHLLRADSNLKKAREAAQPASPT
ncbi:MAG: FadR family transcriptional regulator [Lachnospiraceae bacterium]|nr:FadR family transcriptional regulator [Lachnospiraceae bacterium]